ncbi:protein LIM1-like [Mangifera indica]|uniref:protein LIM1-like n=1 Tax=Mangifera indica TaxID=29780 RepID=UPI001CFB0475|nr:protein LIM1-like [Mangifera indica]
MSRRVRVSVTLLTLLIIAGDQAFAQSSCTAKMREVALECGDYIVTPGTEDSPAVECCVAVNKVGVPCLCDYVTEGWEYLVPVAQKCGKRFHPGSTCGSVTIPSE